MYVLIVTSLICGGAGTQCTPNAVMQEFKSEQTCKEAKDLLLNYTPVRDGFKFKAFCVQK